MKKATQQYSLAQQFFGRCADKEAPHDTYRITAWMRILIAYPFIIVPAWLSIDFFMNLSSYPELAIVFIDVWAMGHAGLLIASILAFLGSLKATGDFGSRVLRHSTLACAVLEVVTALMVAFIIGMSRASPHFFIFLLIVGYRTLFPFRYAFAVLVSTIVVMCAVGSWMYTVPTLVPHLFSMKVEFEVSAFDYFVNFLTFVTIMMILFWAVNFLVNQRNILEAYLTDTVLARYLPAGLVEQASQGKLDFEHDPENRIITILFVDLVGFTRMSQELGAKGVSKVINRFINEVSELAHYHGGTIDKFIGDCVMVFFGAPDSMTPEAQAHRCTEMARSIQERLEGIDWGAEFSARVGISTGDVVVGHFGSNVRSDYTVLGPPVNLAARLETVCEPGKILIGDETAKLLDGAFELETRGPFALKGVGDAVYAWEVIF